MASDLTDQTPAPSNDESAELVALRERVATLEALVMRLTQTVGAAEVNVMALSAEQRQMSTRRSGRHRGGCGVGGRGSSGGQPAWECCPCQRRFPGLQFH
jgi:uncharacterized membrane protein YgcG